MFEIANIWYVIWYFEKNDISKKRSYVKASSVSEARHIAEIRLNERYGYLPKILEIKAI